jgi:pyrimidine operon attenuation protein/uracil phosphoribosyltransferase
MSKTILDQHQIEQKITRIAYQIAENHYRSESILIVGLEEKGYLFAKLIVAQLSKVIHTPLELVSLSIDKNNAATSPIQLSQTMDRFENRHMIVVDDVINSGKTMFYALKPFMNMEFKTIEILVLIERKHKSFPISADYVGMSLNTTMLEHISVVFEHQQAKEVVLQ